MINFILEQNCLFSVSSCCISCSFQSQSNSISLSLSPLSFLGTSLHTMQATLFMKWKLFGVGIFLSPPVFTFLINFNPPDMSNFIILKTYEWESPLFFPLSHFLSLSHCSRLIFLSIVPFISLSLPPTLSHSLPLFLCVFLCKGLQSRLFEITVQIASTFF